MLYPGKITAGRRPAQRIRPRLLADLHPRERDQRRPDPAVPGPRPRDLAFGLHRQRATAARGPSSAATTRRPIQETGAYGDVVGLRHGVQGAVPGIPQRRSTRRRSPSTTPKASEICDGLTHGMYLTLRRRPGRDRHGRTGSSPPRSSSPPCASASPPTRSAACREADPPHRGDLRPRRGFHPAGPDGAGDRRVHAGRGRAPRAQLGLGPKRPAPPSSPAPIPPRPITARPVAPVEPGHVLNMDFGVRVDSYCSDMQRTFYVLKDGESGAAGGRPEGLRDHRQGRRGIAPGHEARRPGPRRRRRRPVDHRSTPATRNSPTPSATRSAASPMTARPSSARRGKSTPRSRSGRSSQAWSSPSSPG